MLRCGNTGGIVGGELCGLCVVHGCEGYKMYHREHKKKVSSFDDKDVISNMTNFEKYRSSLTQDKFIDSMILNCDCCPAYPCNDEYITEDNVLDCEEKLRDWCGMKNGEND